MTCFFQRDRILEGGLLLIYHRTPTGKKKWPLPLRASPFNKAPHWGESHWGGLMDSWGAGARCKRLVSWGCERWFSFWMISGTGRNQMEESWVLAADWPTGKTKWPLEKKESCVRGLLSSSAAALIVPRSFTFNLRKIIENPVHHVSHSAPFHPMDLL